MEHPDAGFGRAGQEPIRGHEPPRRVPSVDPVEKLTSDARGNGLAGGLTGLAGLSTARLSLEDLLTKVAGFAVQAIPGADGAGLTLLETDRADLVVWSAPFVREIDAIQYGIGEGPCITAAATGRTMRSGSLGADDRWPRFGRRAGRLGVHSVLSLPLRTDGAVFGVMNVYAHPKNAFGDHATNLGEQFSVPAASAVQNAQILAQTQRLAMSLQSALTTRAVIDQAVGVLISRNGITAGEALTELRRRSQAEHRPVSAVAAEIVEGAVRRARARRKGN